MDAIGQLQTVIGIPILRSGIPDRPVCKAQLAALPIENLYLRYHGPGIRAKAYIQVPCRGREARSIQISILIGVHDFKF